MRRVCDRCICKSEWIALAALLILLGPAALGQAGHAFLGSNVVHGELTVEGAGAPPGLTVELCDMRSMAPAHRAIASNGGRFEFYGVTPGQYMVRVWDQPGHLLYKDFVNVDGSASALSLKVPGSQRKPNLPGTISFKRLAHKVPRDARKEFEKAVKAAGKGDSKEAVEHLKQAVAIDPEYFEAYNNLGSRYMRLRQPENAVDAFQHAVALDENAAVVHANLGFALFAVRRFADAELSARTAVRLDRSCVAGRLALGFALSAQGREPKEALGHLEAAAPQFPRARLAAAQLLARGGERDRAAEELREYLRTGEQTDRQAVQTWLSDLEKRRE